MILLEHGDIVETLFLKFQPAGLEWQFLSDEAGDCWAELTDFSIDPEGRVRLGIGIVGMGDQDNMAFVPPVHFSVNPSAWNSHGCYVEIELPSPSGEPETYARVRGAMLTELERRLKVINKRLMQRLRREAVRSGTSAA